MLTRGEAIQVINRIKLDAPIAVSFEVLPQSPYPRDYKLDVKIRSDVYPNFRVPEIIGVYNLFTITRWRLIKYIRRDVYRLMRLEVDARFNYLQRPMFGKHRPDRRAIYKINKDVL